MRFSRLLGEYDSETTAFTAFAGAAGTSPYTPDFNGTLVGLRVVPNRSAATSLINHLQFRLTCTAWSGSNVIEVGADGGGLQTAPVLKSPPTDWSIQAPIKAGVPIKLEGRNVTADTPVTVSALLYGIFDG